MTTVHDRGQNDQQRLRRPLNATQIYSTILLAPRDLRTANGRDPESGYGVANESWIALTLGMVVPDTLDRQ
jgi:hypothetical protein